MKPEVHFTKISEKIIELIENSTKSIRLAVAWFTNPEIFEVICTKAKSGLDIEIVISDHPNNFGKLNFDALIKRNKPVWIRQGNGRKEFMHHKFCVIDSQIVTTGSYNWSVSAEYGIENLLIIEDEGITRKYLLHFEGFLKQKRCVLYNEFAEVNPNKLDTIDSELYTLVQEFNRKIFENIEFSKSLVENIDYKSLYFKLNLYTPVGYAKRLANFDQGNFIQSGLEKLAKINRLDLSFEALIISDEFKTLFDAKTIEYARKKLHQLNFIT